jgi:predicted permease
MRWRHHRRLASWRDLRFGLWQPTVSEEVDEELAQHLELRVRELRARGMDAATAHAEALRRFGDLDRIRRDCESIGEDRERAMRRMQWLGELRQDFRYALRQLRRTPAFAFVTVLTLALGIGATTAIFGVVNGVLLKPMPYPDPARLLLLWDDLSWIGVPEAFVTGPEVLRLRSAARLFDGFAAVRSASLGIAELGGAAEPVQLRLTTTSANFFDVLGVRPRLGRGFAPGEDRAGAPLVLVISDGLWRRRYGGDPRIVGRVVDLDGTRATIVGVLPPEFRFATQQSLGAPSDAYAPLQMDLTTDPRSHRVSVLTRVRAGVGMHQALAELATISAAIDKEFYGSHGFRFVPISVYERLVRGVRPALVALLGAVALLALIMCANLATLALSRATRREREFAVRKAIGAARGRITRQVLTETMVLSLAGATLGILFAWWGIRGLLTLAPPGLPRREEIGIDPTVVLFTAGVAIVVGLVVALAPVWYAGRRDLSAVMRERAPTIGANRARSFLVMLQVALSLMLLTATGLLLASFSKLIGVRPGFDARSVVTIDVRASNARYPQPAAVAAFVATYIDRLRALPGVRQVGATSAAPLSGDADQYSIGFPASPINKAGYVTRELVDYAVTTPGYFGAMGIELLPGSRDFTAQDRVDSPPVAIIDESLARKFFPGGSALGQQVVVYGDTSATIVGVARYVRLWNIRDEEGRGQIYRAHAQVPYRGMTIAVRANGDPNGVERAARGALYALDPAQPLANVTPMAEIVALSLGEQRLVTVLVLGFAATALVLAMLGVYGVTAAAVAKRTRELGIRIALGAQQRNVVLTVLRSSVALVAVGLVIGLAGTLALARVLQRLLYSTSATDPRVLAGVAVLTAAVALIAGYIPARAATKVDPARVLRTE